MAALASPVFMAAAIGGWLSGLLPATPVTLGVAALLVVSGPLLGIIHVATAKAAAPEPVAEPEPAAPPEPPVVLTPRAAAAARFAAWRETPNAAIERRERERRAAQHLSAARRRVAAGG